MPRKKNPLPFLPALFSLSLLPPSSGGKLLTNNDAVGSAAYNSTITIHTEVLPVSVDIIGKHLSLTLSPSSHFDPCFLQWAERLRVTDGRYLAARGCDGVIFSLVEALLRAGIITKPQVGRTIAGGQILYK